MGLPMGQNLSNQAELGPDIAEPISLKPLDGFIPFEVLWNCLNLYLCNIMVIWPWPWIFKVKFWKYCLRNGRADWHGTKGMWVDRMLHPLCDFNFDLNHDLDLGFSRSNFESHISGMGWLIDMEWRGCESIKYCTHVVTFNIPLTHDLDLGFPRSNFEMLYLRNGTADWHGMKGAWVDRMLTHIVTSNFDLTHELDLGFFS